jgi:hypothetical protein
MRHLVPSAPSHSGWVTFRKNQPVDIWLTGRDKLEKCDHLFHVIQSANKSAFRYESKSLARSGRW